MDAADMAARQEEWMEKERMDRARIRYNISPFMCYACGKVIPEKRRLALPGTVHCVTCAEEREKG